MTPGVSTWEQLGSATGNLLLIVNSADGNPGAARDVVSRVRQLAPDAAIYAIATPQWRTSLVEHGIEPDRILDSADAAGVELELNHFLQSPAAVSWALAREFRAIVGTAAHSLYNEEIKHEFERNICLLSRDAVFITHALPAPFVFVLDSAELAERFNRDAKRIRYEADVRAMVAGLHRIWVKQGRPSANDNAVSTGAFETITTPLDPRLRHYDEDAPPSMFRESAGMRDQMQHLESVIHEHARLWDEQAREIRRLNGVVDERNAAVTLRDEIIDKLKERLMPLYRKVLR